MSLRPLARSDVAARNLAAARERENAAQALETKQIADARQKELAAGARRKRQKGGRRSPVSLRPPARMMSRPAISLLARERENAAQALETKQIADAKQKELKQALDESERRAFALERELASARKTIASAEKPSNAEVTARDAAAPAGPLNRPMEAGRTLPEITSSLADPAKRGQRDARRAGLFRRNASRCNCNSWALRDGSRDQLDPNA